MTESDWWACQKSYWMLEFLHFTGKATARKFRAFAVDCARRAVPLLDRDAIDEIEGRHDPEKWVRYVCNALEVAQRFLDGRAGERDLTAAGLPTYFDRHADNVVCAIEASLESCRAEGVKLACHTVAAARHAIDARQQVFGNRELAEQAADAEFAAQATALRDIFGPLPFRQVTLPPAVRTWNGGCVVQLATGICEDRDFSRERMGVLADALEEADVTDEEVLGHLHGSGLHCYGCWCVDLVLGKE